MNTTINYTGSITAHSLKIALESFYKSLNKVDFNSISNERITELKKIAKSINSYKNNNLLGNYTRIINKLTTSLDFLSIKSDTEKYIVFMFAIDPNFDILSTYCAEKKVNSDLNPDEQKQAIKKKIWQRFGIYDINLINFEARFIQALKEKKLQSEEIDQNKKR